MAIFKNAKWIWLHGEEREEEYGEFSSAFTAENKQTVCRISCDGDYTLFVNGNYAASNQYGDFEHYKIYDEIDITAYLQAGENKLEVLVWHFGLDTQRYLRAQAGVIFEVSQGESVVLASDEKTACRQSGGYRSGYKKFISRQLGTSFYYDAEKADGGEWKNSCAVEKVCEFYPRPTEKLQILPPKKATVLKAEGKYYLIDLGEETVGLPRLQFTSPCAQKILVAWGEDLQNGHVRRLIHTRDFSYEYFATAGKNDYTNYMLRLGGRYLELYAEEPIELEYCGVLPQIYPVMEQPFALKNELDQRIYDVCVNTLKLSMMEHYVDTPWREQCLYAFDSRNQMLCGYYAFEKGNAEYARANLKLMSEDRRADNLLAICYPCGMDLTIPSFSLYYFMAIKEYLRYTGDISLAEEVYDKLLSITEAFLANSKDGLVQRFDGTNHWNFYDWSRYMEGDLEDEVKTVVPDLMINCLFVLAMESLQEISEKIGKPFPYAGLSEEVKRKTKAAFYNERAGAFALTKGGEEFTVLGNAFAVLSGVAEDGAALCEKLVDGKFIDCSLSMKCFKYDALLQTDKSKWKARVLEEIRADYKTMLDAGATSVWETIDGAAAFEYAGSLCHGWSAIPVYYYHRFFKNK